MLLNIISEDRIMETWTMFYTTFGSAAVIAALAMLFFSMEWRHKLHSKNKIAHRFLIAAVFGVLAIYGSIAAYKSPETGAMCNCRDLAIMYAGLVGGPVGGIGAAIIGGAFRYFVQGVAMGGNLDVAIPCVIACLTTGIISSGAHLILKKEYRYNILVGIMLTAVSSGIHMALLCAFGFNDVAEQIALPMICADCLGIVFCLFMYKRCTSKWNTDKKADIE